MAHHRDAIYNPLPQISLLRSLRNLDVMFGDQTAPAGSDNAPNVKHCCSWTAVEGKKNRPESWTMTFGENYFLIEAYAMYMTDKLAIVKAFSCGASLLACVSFVWAFQLNVLFVRLYGDVYPAFTFKTQK